MVSNESFMYEPLQVPIYSYVNQWWFQWKQIFVISVNVICFLGCVDELNLASSRSIGYRYCRFNPMNRYFQLKGACCLG